MKLKWCKEDALKDINIQLIPSRFILFDRLIRYVQSCHTVGCVLWRIQCMPWNEMNIEHAYKSGFQLITGGTTQTEQKPFHQTAMSFAFACWQQTNIRNTNQLGWEVNPEQKLSKFWHCQDWTFWATTRSGHSYLRWIAPWCRKKDSQFPQLEVTDYRRGCPMHMQSPNKNSLISSLGSNGEGCSPSKQE